MGTRAGLDGYGEQKVSRRSGIRTQDRTARSESLCIPQFNRTSDK
jgi:hypothetical protein